MPQDKILVTGCAGFIGSNLVDSLLKNNFRVVGVDNFNDYYDPKIKEKNIEEAEKNSKFILYRVDITDEKKLIAVFKKEKPDIVVHLAARAGVRHSIDNPELYARVNVLGTVNLLKAAVDYKVDKFVFGSSSSVYGNSSKIPFEEENLCEDIISPYGASKRAAEFFVESFNKNYGIKAIILRFFTVYGQRGRPDMAPSIFVKAITKGKPLIQFGDGSSSRDYTNISDIVDGIIKAINWRGDFDIVNLGSDNPVTLKTFIKAIEKILNRKAEIDFQKQKLGDVDKTWASILKARKVLKWEPRTSLQKGLASYVNWLHTNKAIF